MRTYLLLFALPAMHTVATRLDEPENQHGQLAEVSYKYEKDKCLMGYDCEGAGNGYFHHLEAENDLIHRK